MMVVKLHLSIKGSHGYKITCTYDSSAGWFRVLSLKLLSS